MAAWLMRPGIETAARILYRLDLAAVAPELAITRIAPRPVLLVHGAQDAVIPPEHARRLKDRAANTPAELWMLDGKGHTEGARSDDGNLVPSPDRAQFLNRTTVPSENPRAICLPFPRSWQPAWHTATAGVIDLQNTPKNDHRCG
jgi:hypothetical protein